MAEDIDLPALERDVHRGLFADGLLEIGSGLVLLVAGGFLPYTSASTQLEPLLIFLMMGIVFGLPVAKRTITEPRIGVVKDAPERSERIERSEGVFAIVVTVGILLFGVLLAMGAGRLQQLEPWLGAHWLRYVPGALLLVAFSLLARAHDLARLYLYALLWAGSFTHVLLNNDPIAFMVTGAVMLAIGQYVLARFVRDNPVLTDALPGEEAVDAAE